MRYRFKKGNHWPQWWWLRWLKLWDWPLFYGDTISYKVRFHKDCDQPYMAQWNKLFGFSIGLNPMKHNVRFVFDFFQEDFDAEIQISHYKHEFYKHDGGENSRRIIDFLELEKDHLLLLKKKKMPDGTCHLSYYINGYYFWEQVTEIPYSKWGWKLYPYIGGVSPTQQDCTIEVTRIESKWQYHFKGLALVIAIVILIITINL